MDIITATAHRLGIIKGQYDQLFIQHIDKVRKSSWGLGAISNNFRKQVGQISPHATYINRMRTKMLNNIAKLGSLFISPRRSN